MTLFEPLTSTSPICDIHTLYSKLFVITTKQYSIPSCKYIGESNVNVVAVVPVVESTFTSSGFKTFLPNGRSFVQDTHLIHFAPLPKQEAHYLFREK